MIVLDVASGTRLDDFSTWGRLYHSVRGWSGWSWPGWTVIGDLFAFLAVLAAVVAILYARESAIAARDTVKPMKDMAANLRETAATMKADLTLAERGRQEDHLVRRQQRIAAVVAALTRMTLADRPQDRCA